MYHAILYLQSYISKKTTTLVTEKAKNMPLAYFLLLSKQEPLHPIFNQAQLVFQFISSLFAFPIRILIRGFILIRQLLRSKLIGIKE